MSWKKLIKYWYLIIAAIALAVFFYPKYCGNWATTQPNQGYTYDDCTCVGLKEGPHTVGGGRVYCWGLITSRSCYENRLDTQEQGVYRYYKPCD